jgi:hypothetical protein
MVTNKQIKKWNEEFNSLDEMGKRVLIAKDVIKQIKAERYIPNSTYCSIECNEDLIDESLQKHLPNIECNVCAVGSLFVSHIKYNNKFTVYQADEISTEILEDILEEYFDIKTLILIEQAFEGFGYYNSNKGFCFDNGLKGDKLLSNFNITVEEVDKAVSFNNNYKDRNECLIAIMKNIIKNKGEFVL